LRAAAPEGGLFFAGEHASSTHPATFAAPTLSPDYVDPVVLEGGLKACTEAGLSTNEHEYTGI
jgi:hypothetical protein